MQQEDVLQLWLQILLQQGFENLKNQNQTFFCFWILPCGVQKYSTMRWPAAVQHWWQLLLFSFFFDFFVTISHGCVTYFLCITTTPISQRAAAAVCCCFFVVVEKIEPKLRREKRHSDTIHTPENSILFSLRNSTHSNKQHNEVRLSICYVAFYVTYSIQRQRSFFVLSRWHYIRSCNIK